MVIRAGFLSASALLIASGVLGQISFPGQYPPGQYPPGQGPNPSGGSSIPFPGRGKKASKTTQQDESNRVTTIAIVGVLRHVSSSDLVVEAEDKRVITVSLSAATKYYKATGGSAKTTDLQPGDRVSIDATHDDSGYYHAANVNQIKQGTAEERAAASEPVDASPIADGGNGGDDDRPRLKRSASADDKAQAASPAAAPITPQITRGDSTEPRQTTPLQTAPLQTTARDDQTPAPPDPTDPGPPRLQRGVPAKRPAASSDSGTVIAGNNAPPPRSLPSIRAEEVNGVTRGPQPPKIDNSKAPERTTQAAPAAAKTGDPVIEKAREAGLSFSETLPNYIVKQFTTRYQTGAARGGQTSWRAIDTVSADVVSNGGKETYKNLLVNGKAPKEAVEKSGAWSTGEFSSLLLDILSPGTDADFHNRRSTTIVNRGAYRYDLSVEQANSNWTIYASAESYKPEYTGAIWIDKESSRVLRIELSARNMPKAFPFDTVESAVDYDFVPIGDRRFLVPVHSESLSCERGTAICSRNVIDFRNYKKFGADSSVTFDSTPDK